jgi:MoxR-like ATPase
MMNPDASLRRYRGNGLPPNNDASRVYPYLAGPELVRAVNIAIALQRPLLVKGAPGCGKTCLAASIAHELGLHLDTQLHRWNVKSTSRARDGLYSIDMVRRLQDVQLGRQSAQRLAPYLSFGPLGRALSGATESVVLIDEIDKADIDFPNDLLYELDKNEFSIDELDGDETSDGAVVLRKTYSSATPPIILITSNDEKELPDAFLRRCIFCFIPFPTSDELIEIVRVNLLNLGFDPKRVQLARDLVLRAAERLLRIQAQSGQWRKTPATSELIDWVSILLREDVETTALAKERKIAELPDVQVLFKHQQDLELMRKGAAL